MDAAVLGGLLTGLVGLLAAIIAKTRCYVRVQQEDGSDDYRVQCGAGFTDQVIVPQDSSRIETRELHDNEILFYRKSQ